MQLGGIIIKNIHLGVPGDLDILAMIIYLVSGVLIFK